MSNVEQFVSAAVTRGKLKAVEDGPLLKVTLRLTPLSVYLLEQLASAIPQNRTAICTSLLEAAIRDAYKAAGMRLDLRELGRHFGLENPPDVPEAFDKAVAQLLGVGDDPDALFGPRPAPR